MIRKHTYHTLEDVQLRKEELQAEIEKQNEEIGALWSGLFAPRRANTKGELITNIISNSITAFDAFMLVRKLMTQYGSLFGKKKRR